MKAPLVLLAASAGLPSAEVGSGQELWSSRGGGGGGWPFGGGQGRREGGEAPAIQRLLLLGRLASLALRRGSDGSPGAALDGLPEAGAPEPRRGWRLAGEIGRRSGPSPQPRCLRPPPTLRRPQRRLAAASSWALQRPTEGAPPPWAGESEVSAAGKAAALTSPARPTSGLACTLRRATLARSPAAGHGASAPLRCPARPSPAPRRPPPGPFSPRSSSRPLGPAAWHLTCSACPAHPADEEPCVARKLMLTGMVRL